MTSNPDLTSPASTESGTTPLLEARNLTKRFGSLTAVEDVSFQVHKGVTGLLGPNGAGKSTTMKIFLGLLKPTSGTALILGEDLSKDIEIRSRIGYMPENDCLPPDLSALEFLLFQAQLSGIPSAQARNRSADILRHLRMGEERFRPMGQYSTGMKQRVKLAQALVHDPTFAMLDEPTAGLDPDGRLEMLDLVAKVAQDFDISIILSTHLLGDVERVADSILVLDTGRMTRQHKVAKLTEETTTLYLEVADKQEEVLKNLVEAGVNATRMDSGRSGGQAGSQATLLAGAQIVIENTKSHEYDLIRDAVADAGARLCRLAPQRGSLTDIFME